jgi:hypothetical protein
MLLNNLIRSASLASNASLTRMLILRPSMSRFQRFCI